VNDRCTGTATSTFAGGGGTKVFCSQALKMPIAAMANAVRRIGTPRPIVRCGQEPADERMDFMIHAPMSLFENFLIQKFLIGAIP
jgi:hypothetical protein